MHALLIDSNNKLLAQNVADMLRDCGSEVSCVKDIDAASKLSADQRFHLIVLLSIEEQDLQAIEKLRKEGIVNAVIFAVFEETSDLTARQLITSGIDDILLPPITPLRLESRIIFALRRAQQRFERINIEAALRSSEANPRAIVDTTVDGIITIDEKASILSYNRAAQQIFGYTEAEVLGKNVSMLMPEPYREEHDGYVRSYHETNHKKIIGIGREVQGLRKNGEIFPMELAVSEIKNGKRRYTGIIRDISVRRKLELELLQTSEEERRRIGQDIHDGLGQMLTGIGLITQNIAKNLQSKNLTEADSVFELLDLIKHADEQARTIARTLVPIELEDGGLKAATLRLGNNIERLYNLHCSYEETGDIPHMPSNVKSHFFRIIQEAMGNAARHSKASHISVAIAGNVDKIRARIQDNGIGIDLENANGRGMGLRIMQHRANVIGASLDVRKGSKHGTVVTCTLPLQMEGQLSEQN